LLVLGSAGTGIAPAGAVDWQVLYRLSETLRASDNIQLRPEAEGPGFSSNTTGGLDFAALTPTAEWRTTGTLGHLVYFGEGIPEERERMTYSARSSLLKRTIRTDFNLNASFSMAPATTTVFAGPVPIDPVVTDPLPEDPVVIDPGLTDLELEVLNLNRISYGASAGFAHRWSRIDNLTARVSADWVDFTENVPSVTPHTSAVLSAAWTRLLTRRLDGHVTASVNYFNDESESELQRLLYNAALGATFRPSPRLTVDANAGISVIDQRRDATHTVAEQSDVTLGFEGLLSLSYTPRRDTIMTFSVSQHTSPDGLGGLRSGQAASAAVRYQVNELSSLNLSGTFSNSSATGEGGEATQVWSLSPSYTHALSRHWNLAISYRWIKTDTTESNTALLTLSHRGAILP
jgi:hypothetical protein